MWTYLLIFLAVFTILGIFFRRLFFINKISKLKKTAKEEPEEKNPATETKGVSRNDKYMIDSLFQKAESLIKGGKEEDAIKCYVQILAIDSEHEDTQNKLAMLYMQKGMYAAASALFESLAEKSQDALHYSHLGLAHYHQNNFEEALKAYQAAVNLDPSRPQRFVSLAMVYKMLENLQMAIISLDKALDIEPENIDCLLLMADFHTEKGDVSSAKNYLRKVIKVSPDHEEAILLMKKLPTEKN